MIAMRDAWGKALLQLGQDDARIVVLDADLANSTKADLFADAYPERFIEVGIAEQNMVGIAAGLASLGWRPWLSSFGVFFSQRALDQIRILLSQTGAPVRIGAAYAGLLNGSSGKSHQDIEDLAIMRAMPNMTVIAPADAIETQAATRWAADHDGPVYLRLARDAVADVFPDDFEFVPGRPLRLRQGSDLAIVSTGAETSRVIEAAGLLVADGIDATVIHLGTLKPLDETALLDLLGSTDLIVTVEEHSILGGLGGLVSEIVASRRPGPRVERIGLADKWSESGPNDFLLDKYGLSPRRVARQVKAIIEAPAPAILLARRPRAGATAASPPMR